MRTLCQVYNPQSIMRKTARAFAQVRFAFSIRAAMSNASSRSARRIESCDAVIRVYDEAGNVLETHERTLASSKSGEVFTRITPHFPAKMLGVGNPPMKGK